MTAGENLCRDEFSCAFSCQHTHSWQRKTHRSLLKRPSSLPHASRKRQGNIIFCDAVISMIMLHGIRLPMCVVSMCFGTKRFYCFERRQSGAWRPLRFCPRSWCSCRTHLGAFRVTLLPISRLKTVAHVLTRSLLGLFDWLDYEFVLHSINAYVQSRHGTETSRDFALPSRSTFLDSDPISSIARIFIGQKISRAMGEYVAR